jgi:hypothetical protein
MCVYVYKKEVFGTIKPICYFLPYEYTPQTRIQFHDFALEFPQSYVLRVIDHVLEAEQAGRIMGKFHRYTQVSKRAMIVPE